MHESDLVIYWAIPVFIIVITIEVIINSVQHLHLYQAKDSAASIAMGIGSAVVNLAMKALAFGAMMFLHQFAIFNIGWQWWAWLILFFLEDLSFYWHHRLSHEIRVLWAAHVNHHSSEKLNYSTALRQSWFELIYKYIFWMWLPIIGFDPIMIMILMSVSLIYQFFQHTQLVHKLGPLEWIFNTPSAHRVHHASNARYLDRNHAGILIIWDRIFGTYQEEQDDEKPVYGITQNIHTFNPFKIATHEYAAIIKDLKTARNWKERFMFVFGPPGWSPDGDHKTAKAMRDEIDQQNAA